MHKLLHVEYLNNRGEFLFLIAQLLIMNGMLF
jgi:hypothetical protein